MPAICTVDVYLALDHDNLLVGRARFGNNHGRVHTSFLYNDEYLSSPSAFAISPDLPLISGSHHIDGLPGAFCDASPDRWGRRLIDKAHRQQCAQRQARMRNLDDADYLLGVSDTARQGALRFSAAKQDVQEFFSREMPIPPVVELPALLASSRAVVKDEEGLGALKTLLDAGSSSLGGARPKALVMDGDVLTLAKFSHPNDEWDVIGWEKTILDLAQSAGISVPQSRLVRLGHESVLLTQRFDRAQPSRGSVRLPYISAMSLLGAKDGDTRDYLEILEEGCLLVDDVALFTDQLIRRIALSVAVHNTDDHLRNHGFIRLDGSWCLSPMFDVNPNPIEGAPRVTSIMGEDGAAEAEAVFALAREAGLPGTQVARIASDVLNALDQWRIFARRNGVAAKSQTLMEPVIKAKSCSLRAML